MRAFIARSVRAVRILVRDGRIPRPLRWGGAVGLLPVPGPFDEIVLLCVGGVLWLIYRDQLTEAWRAARPPTTRSSGTPATANGLNGMLLLASPAMPVGVTTAPGPVTVNAQCQLKRTAVATKVVATRKTKRPGAFATRVITPFVPGGNCRVHGPDGSGGQIFTCLAASEAQQVASPLLTPHPTPWEREFDMTVVVDWPRASMPRSGEPPRGSHQRSSRGLMTYQLD